MVCLQLSFFILHSSPFIDMLILIVQELVNSHIQVLPCSIRNLLRLVCHLPYPLQPSAYISSWQFSTLLGRIGLPSPWYVKLALLPAQYADILVDRSRGILLFCASQSSQVRCPTKLTVSILKGRYSLAFNLSSISPSRRFLSLAAEFHYRISCTISLTDSHLLALRIPALVRPASGSLGTF